jgi:hypothetical protein
VDYGLNLLSYNDKMRACWICEMEWRDSRDEYSLPWCVDLYSTAAFETDQEFEIAGRLTDRDSWLPSDDMICDDMNETRDCIGSGKC